MPLIVLLFIVVWCYLCIVCNSWALQCNFSRELIKFVLYIMTLPADKGISKNNDQYTNHYLECQQHVLTDTIQDSTVLNSNLKALMFLIHKDRYHHWRSWTRKHWAKSENESRRSGDQCFKSGPPTGEGGWILSVGSSSLSTSRNLSGPPPPPLTVEQCHYRNRTDLSLHPDCRHHQPGCQERRHDCMCINAPRMPRLYTKK